MVNACLGYSSGLPPRLACQNTTGRPDWVTAKPLEQIFGANGLSPFDSGDRFEQFALFLGSGFEGLPVIVRNDRDLGTFGQRDPTLGHDGSAPHASGKIPAWA